MQTLLSNAMPASAWRWGAYLLRPAQRQLLRDGEPIEVEDRVFDLLQLLLQQRERPLLRQEVIAALWGKRPVGDATLRQLVYKARQAIGDDGEHQATIATLYGRSLQWVAPVTPVFASPAAPTPAPVERPLSDRHAGYPSPSGFTRTLPDPQQEPAIPGALASERPAGNRILTFRRWFRGVRPGWLVAALVLLGAGGGVAWLAHDPARLGASTAPSAPAGTLAVLPFKDLDPLQDQRYVSDGLTDELINRLGQVPRLRVTARTSSFVFRDKAVDVREVADRLGVASVLEGSVQRSGDQWRIRVALVDARTGYERWANAYDAGAGDLLDMEDRIAHNVIVALSPKLEPVTSAGAAIHPRVNAAAHDYYLVGLQYLSRRDTADINEAIALFERAIRVDPAYADAWSGLAIAYAVLRDYNSDSRPDIHYADALRAANRAVLLDPQSARGHMALGQLYEEHWDWVRARGEFELALKLDPSDATAHQWYAIYFWFTGAMQEGVREMRIAHDLDPLSLPVNVGLSRALLFAGDIDGAVKQGEAAVALWPQLELPHLFLASAFEDARRYTDALREIQVGIALTHAPPRSDDLTFQGEVEWLAGDHEAARRDLSTVEARAQRHYVSGVALAWLEWTVGDRDRAFANLQRAAADHDHLLMQVSGIRTAEWCTDPRFGKLLANMNLPPH